MTLWSLLALILAGAVFWAFPGLDMATSRLFFDGSVFPVRQDGAVEALRMVLYWAQNLAALLALMLLGAAAWLKRRLLGLAARDWFYAFAVFALGPGLLVNGIMKPVFARARPWQVEEFGGVLHYTAAWVISDQSPGGRSFVSGEAAGAVALALLCAMLLVANRAKLGGAAYRLGLFVAATLPLVTAWQRVASGSHFLSDVVFGILLTVLLAALLKQAFWRRSHV